LAVAVTSRMHGSLYLNDRITALRRNAVRKTQVRFAIQPPSPACQQPLTGFVPALDEVVMNIDRRRAGKLNIDIVVLILALMAIMTLGHHGMWIEIDSAHECRLGLLSRIDEPAFLVLTKAGMGPIPSDFHAGASCRKKLQVIRGSPECVALPV